MTARGIAYAALQRIDQHGAYANIVLQGLLATSGLSDRDRGFATDLVYGTTRMRRACDAVVDRFVVAEPEPAVRTLLRLGAYQLQFANVAAHAAVSETVELAPKRARGFVNAILRNVTRVPMIWPNEATRLSYPDWIVQCLQHELGVDADAALVKMNEPALVNTRDDGYIQDASSQWVAASIDADPGQTILDVCAAPGGKATAMAASDVFVVAADRSVARVGLIADNARRLSSSVAVLAADGTAPPFRSGSFDHVLLDAPCSGLGALRRRADARWRIEQSDVDDLSQLQASLLETSAALVAPGGTLVYSVCTLTAQESINHRTPDGFVVDDRAPTIGRWRAFGTGWRVLPQDADTDGMVMIRFRRSQ